MPGEDAFDGFMRNLRESDYDRMETCIHCGEEWYTMHHEDGVCHKCQKLGKPGRSVIAKRERRRIVVIQTIICLAIIYVLYLIFG